MELVEIDYENIESNDDYEKLLNEVAKTCFETEKLDKTDLYLSITLSDEEFRQYRYKTQLLSIALYDTPELYFVILAINDMISKKDFCEKTIKLISTDNMLQIINYIYNAEEEYIEDNRISIESEEL